MKGMHMNESGSAKAAKALGMDAPPPPLRVVRPDERADAFESEAVGVFRPTGPGEYVGQEESRIEVSLRIKAAKRRGTQAKPILISGPPGLGKTSMALMAGGIINEDRDEDDRVAVRVVLGSSVKTDKALAASLLKLRESDVLFIDEIHRMGEPSEEMLGIAMEDGYVIVPASGKEAAKKREVKPFTLIAATTRPAGMTKPLRDRFGTHVKLRYYYEHELAEIVRRAAERVGREISPEGAVLLAMAGRETPRVALARWELVRDYADVIDADEITEQVVREALNVAQIDDRGLDKRDRDYLTAIAMIGGGRRVGLSTLVSATGLGERELTRDVEPDLVRGRMLTRGDRGRALTEEGYRHMWPDMPLPPHLGIN